MAYLSAFIGHLLALPITLAALVADALHAIADDENRRADAALVLFVVLLIAGWAMGVFEE